MKKLKIVFIVMGLMLSILLIIHKTGMGGSSLRLTSMAKQQIRFSQRASRAQIGWIFDQRYPGKYFAHAFHLMDNQRSSFYLEHEVTEKLVFLNQAKGVPFDISKWFSIFDDFGQKSLVSKSNLPHYPYSPAGVREEWAQIYESRTLPGYDVATDLTVDDQGNV